MWRVNGVPGEKIAVNNRGLSYGDGVFRTLKVEQGRPLFWRAHYQKLCADAARLALCCPSEDVWRADCDALIHEYGDGVLKLVLTRGEGLRGYRIEATAPTRIVSWSPLPVYPVSYRTTGIALRVCSLRLAQQPLLAGIKHLNRLENVLARAEWSDPDIVEGILLDQSGHVVEGVMSNVFWRMGSRWETPSLDVCGVAGITRDWVIHYFRQASIGINEVQADIERVLLADELFICNSLLGLCPVATVEGRRWSDFEATLRLHAALKQDGEKSL